MDQGFENLSRSTNVIKAKNVIQGAKDDTGKPRLTLVPTQILYDVARAREYGLKKYDEAENWRTIEIERWRDAFFRHWLAYLKNPKGLDAESGLPHLWHAEWNLAAIAALEAETN